MTKNEIAIILDELSAIREANNECHNAMLQQVEAGMKALRAEFNANAFVVNERLQKIEQHLARQNGSIKELWDESDKRKIAVEDFRRLESKLKWLRKNWLLIMFLAIFFIVIVTLLYDIGAIDQIINKIIDKL